MKTPDDFYAAEGGEITATDIQQMMHTLRRCQRYIDGMKPGQDKKDLLRMADLAGEYILETAGEHGFNTIDEICALEDGNIAAHTIIVPKEEKPEPDEGEKGTE